MRRFVWSFLLAVMLTGSGCVPTLHTIFTPEDTAFDPSLSGTWESGDSAWTFRPLDAKSGRYQLDTVMKDQPAARWYATLGTIGAHRFIELLPQRPDAIHAKTFFGGHFIELRSFWKMALDGDSLTLTSLSSQWFDAKLKQGRVTLKHEQPEGGMLFLTASTEDLQAFLERYADDPGAFPSGGDEGGMAFQRMADSTTPTEP